MATPTISGPATGWTHGGSVTITGTNFGTKSPAAPTIWDNCMHGQSLTTRWSGGWPTSSSYAPNYRTEQRSQTMPHARTTKYLCAANWQDGGYDNGLNAMFWKSFGSIQPYIFFSHRMRIDSSFSSGDNFKFLDYSCGTSPYTQDSSVWNNWYIEESGGLTSPNWDINLNDDGGSLRPWADPYYWGDYYGEVSRPSPKGAWRQIEGAWYLTSTTNGIIRIWQDGVSTLNYSSTNPTYGALDHWTDRYTAGARNVAFGGYTRTYSTSNWRYWTDLYLDVSWARVVLGNASTYTACTVREMQIPSAWNANGQSITATVNLGSFGDTGTVYLYVVNSGDEVNSAGYEVTLGGGDPPSGTIVLSVR